MDLHANSTAAFEQDILANEPTLRIYMQDADWRWFRYPFLREGETAEKHRAIADFLKQHGYRIAEVTLNFDDYAYNDPYSRCMTKGDEQAITWLRNSYLSRASAYVARGEEMSRLIYGREINYVMLLHIGGFETVMLPRLLDLLKQRGFKFVTLEEAERDPAYSEDPSLPSTAGTLLDQMMIAKHIPPIQRPDDTFSKLDKVCR
jgi:peptidoglycan/xylan/chitin deacetylase (PgdA/CDA1 family)